MSQSDDTSMTVVAMTDAGYAENVTTIADSTPPKLTINDVVRQVESILFPIVFVIASLMNVCVIMGLVKNKLHISTKMMMMYQACNSIIGLGANGIYYPIVIVYGGYPEPIPSLLHNLPGAFTLGAIYSGMAILLFIAVQRVAFLYLPLWSREAFNVKSTSVGIFACALFGSAWAIHCLFECCRFEYSLSLGKWLYDAQMAPIQGKAVLVTMAVFPIATSLCYIAAGVKLILIKRKNRIGGDVHIDAVSGHAISFVHSVKTDIAQQQHKKEVARERKVLVQFAIISVVWCVYSTMFNIIQQIPSLRIQEIALTAECFRMLVYTIDPIVYLVGLKEIRENVIAMFKWKPTG